MKFLLSQNRFVILLTILIFFLSIGYILDLVITHFYPEPVEEVSSSYLILKFGFGVLFAPLVETLICQHWLIPFTVKKLPFNSHNKKWLWAIIISSIFFGLGHTYNPVYVIGTMILGLIFGATYWLFTLRKDIHPAMAVFIIHFINNFLAFVTNDLRTWH